MVSNSVDLQTNEEKDSIDLKLVFKRIFRYKLIYLIFFLTSFLVFFAIIYFGYNNFMGRYLGTFKYPIGIVENPISLIQTNAAIITKEEKYKDVVVNITNVKNYNDKTVISITTKKKYFKNYEDAKIFYEKLLLKSFMDIEGSLVNYIKNGIGNIDNMDYEQINNFFVFIQENITKIIDNITTKLQNFTTYNIDGKNINIYQIIKRYNDYMQKRQILELPLYASGGFFKEIDSNNYDQSKSNIEKLYRTLSKEIVELKSKRENLLSSIPPYIVIYNSLYEDYRGIVQEIIKLTNRIDLLEKKVILYHNFLNGYTNNGSSPDKNLYIKALNEYKSIVSNATSKESFDELFSIVSDVTKFYEISIQDYIVYYQKDFIIETSTLNPIVSSAASIFISLILVSFIMYIIEPKLHNIKFLNKKDYL